MKNIFKLFMVLSLMLTANVALAQDNTSSTVDLSVYKSMDANEGAMTILTEADVQIAGVNTAVGFRVTNESSVKVASLALGKAYSVGKLTVTPSILGAYAWIDDYSTYNYGLDGDVNVPILNWLSATGKVQWVQDTEAKPSLDRFRTNFLLGAKIKL
jgi:hypothetical protein